MASTRKSPATSAKLLPGKRRKGGDGRMWVSEKRGKAPYRWYPVAGKKASGKRPASTKKKTTTKGPARAKSSAKKGAASKEGKKRSASASHTAAKALKVRPLYRVPGLKRLLAALPAASQERFKKFTGAFLKIRKLGVYIDLINHDHTATVMVDDVEKPLLGRGHIDELWSDFEQVLVDNGLKDPKELSLDKQPDYVIAAIGTFAGEDALRQLVPDPPGVREIWKHGKKARLVHKAGTPYYFQHHIKTKETAQAVKKVLEDAGLKVNWPMGQWKKRAIGVVI